MNELQYESRSRTVSHYYNRRICFFTKKHVPSTGKSTACCHPYVFQLGLESYRIHQGSRQGILLVLAEGHHEAFLLQMECVVRTDTAHTFYNINIHRNRNKNKAFSIFNANICRVQKQLQKPTLSKLIKVQLSTGNTPRFDSSVRWTQFFSNLTGSATSIIRKPTFVANGFYSIVQLQTTKTQENCKIP